MNYKLFTFYNIRALQKTDNQVTKRGSVGELENNLVKWKLSQKYSVIFRVSVTKSTSTSKFTVVAKKKVFRLLEWKL